MDNECKIRKRKAGAMQMMGQVMCKSQDERHIKTRYKRELILLFAPWTPHACAGNEKCEVCVILGGLSEVNEEHQNCFVLFDIAGLLQLGRLIMEACCFCLMLQEGEGRLYARKKPSHMQDKILNS